MAITIRIGMDNEKKPFVAIAHTKSYSVSGTHALQTAVPATLVGEDWTLGSEASEKLSEKLIEIINNGLRHRTAALPGEIKSLSSEPSDDVPDGEDPGYLTL